MKHNCLKLAATSAVAAALLFTPGGKSGASDPPRKVVICHKGNTIEVAESALQAHLDHGDTRGPCQVTPGQNR